jgi:hypothetical protein
VFVAKLSDAGRAALRDKTPAGRLLQRFVENPTVPLSRATRPAALASG